jgi:hypothetical protein
VSLKKSIVWYISGHGFGHGVRQSFLINRIPREYPVYIVSSLEKKFFEEEITRPFLYRNQAFDCGCCQIDSLQVNITHTLSLCNRIFAQNDRIRNAECRWLKSTAPGLVISDIASYPAVLAQECGVPSLAAGNFTWYDIYSPYTKGTPAFIPVLRRLYREYSLFDYWIHLYPGVPPQFFGRQYRKNDTLLRPGSNRRRELCSRFNLCENTLLILVYLGNYGIDSIDWNRVYGTQDVVFLGYYPPETKRANFIPLDKSIPLQDYSASCDIILSKLGYNTVCEALNSQKPLLYFPRSDFAEHSSLEKSLHKWGRGSKIENNDLYSGGLKDIILNNLRKKEKEPLCDTGVSIWHWIKKRIDD